MGEMLISSKTNPSYKRWLKYCEHPEKNRDIYLLEGLRLCRDAVEAGEKWRILEVCFNDAALRHETGHAFYQLCVNRFGASTVNVFADNLFAKLADTVSSQGIMMAVSPEGERPTANWRRVLLLERVQDPGNLGSIWRSADAFGFDAVILAAGGASPNNRKTLRSAMGSVFHVPVLPFSDTEAAYTFLKQENFWIAAATLDGRPLAEIARRHDLPKIALAIGNEGNGLSSYARKEADATVYIPISGKAESLNAACAAGILCYEFREAQ